MKMKANIKLIYAYENEAKTIAEAISPENIKTSSNLNINTFFKENKIYTTINYHGNNLLTLLTTIDDLLYSIAIAEKIIHFLKKHE